MSMGSTYRYSFHPLVGAGSGSFQVRRAKLNSSTQIQDNHHVPTWGRRCKPPPEASLFGNGNGRTKRDFYAPESR